MVKKLKKKTKINTKKSSVFSRKQLEKDLLLDFKRLSNEKRSKSDIRRSKNFEKRQREKNRKNDRNSKKRTAKVTRKTKSIYSVSMDRALKVITFYTKLAKADELDLFDLNNQDSQLVYSVIYPYFHELLKRVRKKSQYFRIAINYFDLVEYDTASTPLADFDDIPRVVEKDVLYLVERLINKAQEYKKFHTIFKLMSVELTRYDELPKKRKK